MNLFCECGWCGKEHDFIEEYVALVDGVGGLMRVAAMKATTILVDCDNGGHPFFELARTEHLKIGVSLPMGTVINQVELDLKFHPLHKTILN